MAFRKALRTGVQVYAEAWPWFVGPGMLLGATCGVGAANSANTKGNVTVNNAVLEFTPVEKAVNIVAGAVGGAASGAGFGGAIWAGLPLSIPAAMLCNVVTTHGTAVQSGCGDCTDVEVDDA